MKVRELITNLLDYDMDYDVEIRLETAQGTDEHSFSIDESHLINTVYFDVDCTNYELVEKDRLAELEEAEYEYKELLSNQ